MEIISVLYEVSWLRFLPYSFQHNLHLFFYFPSCFLRCWINVYANIATGDISIQFLMTSELLSRQDICYISVCMIEAGPRPYSDVNIQFYCLYRRADCASIFEARHSVWCSECRESVWSDVCSPVLRLPLSLQTTPERQVQETAVATQEFYHVWNDIFNRDLIW